MADVDINKFRASVVREGSKPASPGFVVSEGQSPTDPAGSGQNHLPVTIATAATGLSITESQVLGGAGNVGQYIRGDGSLADFPESSGGGSSVSYYLNGSVAQGTIGGIAYKELNKVPILGAGTDFTINADGYIASFITDAGDPNLIEIPGGNWNFETYFSASSSGGSPSFYVELYKVNSGGTATLIASNSTFPELIAFGTNIISYFSTLAVPTTTLALTDRLAIRYYVTHSGRTITLHTEDNHLCQIITTFTTGITALNGLTAQVQNFAVGTSGTDFNIASATATHTFNLPTASATNRGALSSADWSTFNGKENAITAGTTAQYFRGDKTFQTLNTAAVPELTNLYYTEARVNANTNVAANTAARHNAVTLGTANGLSLSTQVLSLGLASAGVTGALSGTDWTTFNSKQNALTNPVTGTGTTNYLPKFTGSTTIGNSNLINDASGNLGLGVTPSAWGSNSFAFQTQGGALWSFSSIYIDVWQNSYFNGSNSIYSTNNAASFYRQTIGEHQWFNAPSGTAGNAITWSQAMTLTSGRNLLVGTTTDNGARLQVSGTATFSSNLTVGNGTTAVSLIINRGAAGDGNGLRFATAGTLNWYIGSAATSTNTDLEIYNHNTATTNLRLAYSTGAATFSSSVTAASLSLSGTIASGGDAATLTIKQAGTTFTNGIYLERGGERNGYYMYIGGGLDALTFRRNYFGTQSDVMSLTRDGNVGLGTSSPGQKLQIEGSLLVNAGTSASAFRDIMIGGIAGWSGGESHGIDTVYNTAASPTTFSRIESHFDGTSGRIRFRNLFFNSAPRTDILMTIEGNGNVLIGNTTDNGSKLQVNGAIRTAQPVGTTSNGWLLGRALVSGTSTPNRWIRVQIGLEYYDILAVYMGTL